MAGLIVQEVTNTKFTTYVNENILNPLGMANSTFDFPKAYETNDDYANAYIKAGKSFREVQIYPRHAIPAGSLVSNSEDMGLFIKALFNRDTDLLSANSWGLFYTQQFKNHSLLNGYGYGLEHQNINGHNAWAKGGMLPGVLSHILIVPNEFAIFSVVNTSNDNFGESFYKILFDMSLPDITTVRELKKDVSTLKYTGAYRNKRYSKKPEDNIVSLFRSQFNIYDNATHDSLVLYHNGQWNTYVPVDEGIFQNHLLPYEYLVFEKDEKGKISTLYRNLNIGGLSIPTSYEKTKWYNGSEFINEYYGLVPIFTFTGLFFMLFSLFVRLIGKWKKGFFGSKKLSASFHILFSTTIILHLLHTYFVPFQMLKKAQEFLYGYPDSFRIVSVLGYLLIPLTIGLGFFIWKMFKNKQGSLFARIYIPLVEVSLLIHIAYLYYWSFL